MRGRGGESERVAGTFGCADGRTAAPPPRLGVCSVQGLFSIILIPNLTAEGDMKRTLISGVRTAGPLIVRIGKIQVVKK